MDAAEIGWLAGIIEGEGTIRVHPRNSHVAIAVKMTDEDVIRRIQTVTGVGSVTGPRQPPGNRKPIWTWECCNRTDAARIFLAIYPLMGERRQSRIRAAAENIQCLKRMPPVCGTFGGYKKHLRLGEPTCPECRRFVLSRRDPVARKAAVARYRAKRRANHVYARQRIGAALAGDVGCSAEGCSRAAKNLGMCGAHYQQDWKARRCSA